MREVPVIIGCLALAGWIHLALFHGRFWQLLLDRQSPEPSRWPSIDIVVPARNEATVLPETVPSLVRQQYTGSWRIVLVDDQSDDGTSAVAKQLAIDHGCGDRLSVIVPPPREPGWSGKVAAMNAGAQESHAEYILFTDADIEHPPDSLALLVARAIENNLDLTSRMVRLECGSAAERLLVPAFVFFFAMLCPFRRANDPGSPVAAAAGGVMLVKRTALDRIGGLAAIKSALIDDCSLARAIKRNGGRIELMLADDVRSLRRYPRFRDIHQMVARTAYTQLNYSMLLLAGTTLGMALLFLVPVLLLISANWISGAIGVTAWLIMALIYMPMIRFYKLPATYAFTLPLAAAIYLIATLDSARLHWLGKGGQWKGRTQSPSSP